MRIKVNRLVSLFTTRINPALEAKLANELTNPDFYFIRPGQMVACGPHLAHLCITVWPTWGKSKLEHVGYLKIFILHMQYNYVPFILTSLSSYDFLMDTHSSVRHE